MKTLKVIFVLIILIFIQQCSSSKTEEENKTNAHELKDFSYNRIAPGTAEITATLIKTISKKNNTVGIFKIDSVHGYGHSTKPIGIGSQLKIEFTENFMKSNEVNSSEIFVYDTKYKLTIAASRSVSREGQSKIWQVVKIH